MSGRIIFGLPINRVIQNINYKTVLYSFCPLYAYKNKDIQLKAEQTALQYFVLKYLTLQWREKSDFFFGGGE